MCKINSNKQLIIKGQHGLGGHEEQPLIFSLVHLILCYKPGNHIINFFSFSVFIFNFNKTF